MHWPRRCGPTVTPRGAVLADDDLVDELIARCGAVVLTVSATHLSRATPALSWAADHAAELGRTCRASPWSAPRRSGVGRAGRRARGRGRLATAAARGACSGRTTTRPPHSTTSCARWPSRTRAGARDDRDDSLSRPEPPPIRSSTARRRGRRRLRRAGRTPPQRAASPLRRRLLISAERAEDALQETCCGPGVPAPTSRGAPAFRTWLYRIATNSCLDEMGRDRNRPLGLPVARATPFEAEGQLPALASTDPGPDVLLEARESVERACRTVIELLPPRQRAVLILCDVLRCSSGETAQLLDMTVAAVNSARQRARVTLDGRDRPRAGRRRPEPRAAQPTGRCSTATSTRCAVRPCPRWSRWLAPTPTTRWTPGRNQVAVSPGCSRSRPGSGRCARPRRGPDR